MREFYPLPPAFDRIAVTPEGNWRRESGPIPALGPRDLLFQLIAAGVTPGDTAPSPGERYPRGLPVGEIAAVGDAASGWNPLDRALILPPEDAQGPPDPGLGEFLLVRGSETQDPASSRLFKLSENIPAEDATLLPAAATAAHILREAALPSGGRLLVVGLGLVGQILVLLARHQRVERIAAADPSPTLRAKVEWSGATRVIRVPDESLRDAVLAETGGQGVHAAAVLLADPLWLGEASRVLGPRGALLVAADFPPGFALNIAPAWVRRGEVRIQGVRGYNKRDLRDAVRAVNQGIVNAENLLTKRIAWRDLESADLTPEFWAHATHVVLEGPES